MTDLENSIVIDRILIKENQIFYKFKFPERIRSYFRADSLQISYECSLANLPDGILMIPAICQVAPIAWVTNCDIDVSTLDETFLSGIKIIQQNISSLLPAFKCRSVIYADHIEHFSLSGDRRALLFTGGIDSVASLIRHQHQIRDLIYIRGADVPLHAHDILDTIISYSQRMAVNNEFNYQVVDLDIWNFLNMPSLDKDFWKLLKSDWWGAIQHGISLLGSIAPLCAQNGISTVLISSSFTENRSSMHGSHPMIDENIHWGENTQVRHVDFDLTRQAKIHEIIKPWSEENGELPLLKVCCNQWETYNCCTCEKCCRTICGLLLENLNPRLCGFPCFDEATLRHVKSKLISGKFTSDDIMMFFWKDIQSHIDHLPETQKDGIAEFFEWFRNYRLHAPNSPGRLQLLLRRGILSIEQRINKLVRFSK